MIPLIIRGGGGNILGRQEGFYLFIHSTVYLPTILLGSGQTEKEDDPLRRPPHPAMVEDRDEECDRMTGARGRESDKGEGP